MNRIQRIGSTFIIGSTLFTSLLLLKYQKPNAVQVSVNDNAVMYVSNTQDFQKAYNDYIEEVKKKYKYGDVYCKIDYKNINVKDSYITKEPNIKNLLYNTKVIKVPAYLMKSDGKIIGNVLSEKSGNLIIDDIKNYYIKNGNIQDVKTNDLKNKISYEKCLLSVNMIKNELDTEAEILNNNERENYSLIGYTFFCEKTVNEVLPYAETIKWSADLNKGQQKVVQIGANGISQKIKQSTYFNDRLIKDDGNKTITIKAPIERIVMRGTKEISSTALLVPSRGSITSYFGARWGKMHLGIDIAANTGDPIRAAMDGIVAVSEWETSYGNVVKIDGSLGIRTIYGHCSKLLVKKGQKVNRGDLIALVGSTGNSTGPHVHFEVRKNGIPQNPLLYLH